ncbi:hypothetical protein KCU74_g50, partial [Aureobasidium melanogenum]
MAARQHDRSKATSMRFLGDRCKESKVVRMSQRAKDIETFWHSTTLRNTLCFDVETYSRSLLSIYSSTLHKRIRGAFEGTHGISPRG